MPPIEKPTTDRLIEILRINDEAGDILCGHAADEIERLRLTPEERKAIEIAAGVIEDEYLGTSCTDKLGAAVLLYGLLDRIGPTAGR
jgi:hypothetical protein